jgi:hypothetical protein
MFDRGQSILPAPKFICNKTVEDHHTKTDIVVPVIRVVVVADRDTRVVFIVVPRATPQTL